MSTPHIEADRGAFAETVLLPGDPLRAQAIAERLLDDAQCISRVRNMLAFTGRYHGHKVSVMGTGMGMPSMGIYSHELITTYGVKRLIRIGTAGAYSTDLALGDLVVAGAVSTDSNWAGQFHINGTVAAAPSFSLLRAALRFAEARHTPLHVAHIKSSDVFYEVDSHDRERWMDLGVEAVEMETYALYVTAARLGAEALSLLTISDHVVAGGELSRDTRERSLTTMIDFALSLATEVTP